MYAQDGIEVLTGIGSGNLNRLSTTNANGDKRIYWLRYTVVQFVFHWVQLNANNQQIDSSIASVCSHVITVLF